MTDEVITGTPVVGDNIQPANTDADAVNNAEKSESTATPRVELRDGKYYIDGVRVYSRDDTNRIAANAKKEVESRLLGEFEVDSFDQIKTVVSQLRNVSEEPTLNVQNLREAVKKKEQTVEELRAELQRVKTDMVLKDHLTQLHAAMPASWNADQRTAVVDLMKARNMLHLEGETFAIRNADTVFVDESGERPDYAAAVTTVGKTLGLPLSKTGVATFDAADKTPADANVKKGVDDTRLKSDPSYRSAYVSLRDRNPGLSRSDITDTMIRNHLEKTVRASTAEKGLVGYAAQANKLRR